MTDKFINLLKNYGSDSLQSLDAIYSDDVQYEDPINKGKDLDHLKPVSYTHLTLPTILLV